MAARVLLVALLLVTASAALAQTETAPKPKAKPVYPMPPPVPPIVAPPGSRDGAARTDTFTDKATRCLHYANSIGVPRDQMDDYMKRCTLQ